MTIIEINNKNNRDMKVISEATEMKASNADTLVKNNKPYNQHSICVILRNYTLKSDTGTQIESLPNNSQTSFQIISKSISKYRRLVCYSYGRLEDQKCHLLI